jgi:DNA replication and repair protein RecF
VHVRRLELVDFRSYRTVQLDLEPGASVLVGPNGIGKTNLVEALGYVATLASHRVATDAPLVRSGCASAVVRCTVVHEGRELLVELELVPGKANRARLGHSPVRRPREVVGALRMVLFAPEDIELVRGEPAARRRYLDDLLVARRPRFAAVCADYDRVVRQRNALLRTAQLARRAGTVADLSTLEAWDAHLARHGAELLAGRLELVDALRPHVAAGYDAVAGGVGGGGVGGGGGGPGSAGGAGLGYRSSLFEPASAPERRPQPESEPQPDPGAPVGSDQAADPVGSDQAALAAALAAGLARARTTELERGVTTIGPHRDDLALTLGLLPAKGYASHGECWSFAVALRLAAYRLLRSDGVEPVLVLDDVFAELDTGRRDRLARSIADATQTLVTCAVEEDVPAALRGARYLVREGEVKRV